MNRHSDRSTPPEPATLIPNVDPARPSEPEDIGKGVAILNPGTGGKTADIDPTGRLGAAGELTQGARTSDMQDPSKA